VRSMSWPVAAVDIGASVAEVAEALTADEVGAMVVLERGTMVGIVSERDVTAHLAAAGNRESDVVAGEVMSRSW
jgi:CBS domain-containing protein